MTHPILSIRNRATAAAARFAGPAFVATLALVVALSMTVASNRHVVFGGDFAQTQGESSIAQSEPLGMGIIRQPVRVAGRDG